MKQTSVNATSLTTCDEVITPACVAALYKIPHASGNVSASNSLGIFEEGDYYAQEDLDLFFRNFTPYIPKGTHPKPAFIDGASAPVSVADAGAESDLDFQLAYPIVYPQTITLYQTDDYDYASGEVETDGFFNTFLDAVDGVSWPLEFSDLANDSVILHLLCLWGMRRQPDSRSHLPR